MLDREEVARTPRAARPLPKPSLPNIRGLVVALLGAPAWACAAPPPEVSHVDVEVPGSAPPPPLVLSAAASERPSATPPPLALLDYAVAAERARLEHRPLFVLVRASWSARAIELERSGVLDSTEVRRALGPFVAARLDASSDESAARQLERLGALTVPSLVLYDPGSGRRALVPEPLDKAAIVDAASRFVVGER